ncbi:MAG: sirohydrochlorin cobaltochelatase [Spirochaetales bacterium]|nr:sirohydrochlorin cobaltochelatase [Spirochaetales bacterium]
MSSRKALLVVSFGTSHEDTLEKTIQACENSLAEAFPGYDLKRAFTSHIIIRKLARERSQYIDTPAMAVERLLLEGYEEVHIQPLHIIPGEEYHHKVLSPVLPFREKFRSFTIGEPLLFSHTDYDLVLDALEDQMPDLGEGEALVLMGHGTEHPANACYSCLQVKADERGLPVEIGCVEGYPELDRVVDKLKEKGYRRLHLMPLMLVSGDHAVNDMAGDDEESWKSVLEAEGYDVKCYLQGLGENPLIQKIFNRKALSALSALSAEKAVPGGRVH